MHIVTHDNYGEATDAVRDILMMYVCMAEDTQGFGHASNVYIRFDPLKYIDAADDGQAYYLDLDLLRSGCAVALLCGLYDAWCEGHLDLTRNRYLSNIRTALAEGRFGAFPDIEVVANEAFRRGDMPLDDLWFEEAVVSIYRKYVLGLFQRLGTLDRASSNT